MKGGWKYKTKNGFIWTVWDEKHTRVKAGKSKVVSIVSCSRNGWANLTGDTVVWPLEKTYLLYWCREPSSPGPWKQHGCTWCKRPVQGDWSAGCAQQPQALNYLSSFCLSCTTTSGKCHSSKKAGFVAEQSFLWGSPNVTSSNSRSSLSVSVPW